MKQTIREAVKALLDDFDNLTTVSIGRRHAYDAAQLNAASVFTDSEESERITMRPATYSNEIELKVVFYVKPSGADLGEDTVDALVAEADAAIVPAVEAIDGVFDVLIDSLTIEGDGTDADADYLMATRTYRVVYHSAAPSA